MEKQELRRYIIQKRRSLSEEYRRRAGTEIRNTLINHPVYRESRTVLLYAATPDEPDMEKISEQAWRDSKKVYLPLCLPRSSGRMLAVRVSGWNDLAPRNWGILEPKSITETISPTELDLVVLPCVAASLSGKRLGHGGGYYDRFLSACISQKQKPKLVCLCFYELITEDIPMTERDIRMDAVITEKGYFSVSDKM